MVCSMVCFQRIGAGRGLNPGFCNVVQLPAGRELPGNNSLGAASELALLDAAIKINVQMKNKSV